MWCFFIFDNSTRTIFNFDEKQSQDNHLSGPADAEHLVSLKNFLVESIVVFETNSKHKEKTENIHQLYLAAHQVPTIFII